MKLATILPVKHLNLIENDDYFMCLAHIAKQNTGYTNFFKRQAEAGKYIMLDSGVVETGTPMSIEEMVEIATEIKASELVLPDFLRNAKKTLSSVWNSIDYLTKCNAPFNIMIVPQGYTARTWLACARTMASWDVPLVLGVSYTVVLDDLWRSRKEAISAVFSVTGNHTVHLLGCKNPEEVYSTYAEYPTLVRGVDSTLPYLYAKHEMRLSDKQPRPERDLDFINDEVPLTLLKKNIAYWRVKSVYGEAYYEDEKI